MGLLHKINYMLRELCGDRVNDVRVGYMQNVLADSYALGYPGLLFHLDRPIGSDCNRIVSASCSAKPYREIMLEDCPGPVVEIHIGCLIEPEDAIAALREAWVDETPYRPASRVYNQIQNQ